MPGGAPLLCFLKNIKFPAVDREEAFTSQLQLLSSVAGRQRPRTQASGLPWEALTGKNHLKATLATGLSSEKPSFHVGSWRFTQVTP